MWNEKLKQLRKEMHLRQIDVANNLHIALSTYNGYERGRSEPTIEQLIYLANLYKVPLDLLLDRHY